MWRKHRYGWTLSDNTTSDDCRGDGIGHGRFSDYHWCSGYDDRRSDRYRYRYTLHDDRCFDNHLFAAGDDHRGVGTRGVGSDSLQRTGRYR